MSSKSSGGQICGGGPDRASAVQQLRPPLAQRREHGLVRRAEGEEAAGSAAARRKRPSEGLDDSKLGQVAQLHVTERLPGTDDGHV